MKLNQVLFSLLALSLMPLASHAGPVRVLVMTPAQAASVNALDELNPNEITEEQLKEMDAAYQAETGQSPFIGNGLLHNINNEPTCFRETCRVWAHVNKATQTLSLYIDGQPYAQWPVSTGKRGTGTPNFDRHPNGRIYNAYMSKKFPGGDYNGLGNMPYAVFIEGGFAIHGTGTKNWPMLGRPASHGCIRLHPDNALIFNQFVREAGVTNTWITVD